MIYMPCLSKLGSPLYAVLPKEDFRNDIAAAEEGSPKFSLKSKVARLFTIHNHLPGKRSIKEELIILDNVEIPMHFCSVLL